MGTATLQYYQSNRDRFLAGLTDLLRIQSISTLPEHKPDVRRACDFLADELRAMGMQRVEIIEGKESQNPLLYAEWTEAPGKPTSASTRRGNTPTPSPKAGGKSAPPSPDPETPVPTTRKNPEQPTPQQVGSTNTPTSRTHPQ